MAEIFSSLSNDTRNLGRQKQVHLKEAKGQKQSKRETNQAEWSISSLEEFCKLKSVD